MEKTKSPEEISHIVMDLMDYPYKGESTVDRMNRLVMPLTMLEIFQVFSGLAKAGELCLMWMHGEEWDRKVGELPERDSAWDRLATRYVQAVVDNDREAEGKLYVEVVEQGSEMVVLVLATMIGYVVAWRSLGILALSKRDKTS